VLLILPFLDFLWSLRLMRIRFGVLSLFSDNLAVPEGPFQGYLLKSDGVICSASVACCTSAIKDSSSVN
jgi:hypothetical protein